MQINRLQHLVEKYLNQTASDHEIKELFLFYEKVTVQKQNWDESKMGKEGEVSSAILYRIHNQLSRDHKKSTLRPFTWYSIAASILICLSVLFFYNKKPATQKYTAKTVQIKAGRNRAILTLSNGQKIALEQTTTGTIAKQGRVQIEKTRRGGLVYAGKNNVSSKTKHTLTYNTIETPKGGKYELTLPDGTRVWLNSATILRYPIDFTGVERKVSMEGEAYFEVQKDPKKPFIVLSRNQQIQVFGTHFNINAYNDEPQLKTTLLEGSIRVSSLNNMFKAKLLKPGEQALITGKNIYVAKVDMQAAIDWKNGLFIFDNENIFTAMRKLARWYDVDIQYSGKFDNIYFGGAFPRKNNLQETLKILELTNKLKFKIEGRSVTVIE